MATQQNTDDTTDDSTEPGRQTRENQTADQNSRHAEEPVMSQDESVPTDGIDTEGEEMMKSVRNDLLEEPAPKP